MTVLLGCIADDFTGGTDLAGMLVKHGMRTVQMIGVPDGPPPDDVDAVVVALKSRTIPAADAVAESLAALQWLRAAGCQQYYFKYCSTFDSTAHGNIGPVSEALMKALGTDFSVVCPAFPANKRTIYKGYLFVGDVPLNESSMQHHPLTPMTDANLVRVMQAQSTGKVGLVPYEIVRRGETAIRDAFLTLKNDGHKFAVVDALSNDDLVTLGAACSDVPLVTAASGLALGLPGNFAKAGLLTAADRASNLPRPTGSRAVIAGSCSTATLEQIAVMRSRHPARIVDPLDLAKGTNVVGETLAWAEPHLRQGPVLIYASATPAEVKAAQAALGKERASTLIEDALAEIAVGLVDRGVGQLIVAGGETSGAVVKALGIKSLRIGPEIDPGVPWIGARQKDGKSLLLALKSGNFGTADFFLKAWEYIVGKAA